MTILRVLTLSALALVTGCAVNTQSSEEAAPQGELDEAHALSAEKGEPLYACPAAAYSGRATGVEVTAGVLGLGATVVACDTGALSSSGGKKNVELATADVEGLARTGVIHSKTASKSEVGTSSSAIVDGLSATIAGVGIAAKTVKSAASATCGEPLDPVLKGSSRIEGLTINGLAVTVTDEPNQTIVVGPVTIILDEVLRSSSPEDGDIQVNAIHIKAAGIADVIVSASSAGVTCQCPT